MALSRKPRLCGDQIADALVFPAADIIIGGPKRPPLRPKHAMKAFKSFVWCKGRRILLGRYDSEKEAHIVERAANRTMARQKCFPPRLPLGLRLSLQKRMGQPRSGLSSAIISQLRRSIVP